MAIFNSFLLVYQRVPKLVIWTGCELESQGKSIFHSCVKLPEGICSGEHGPLSLFHSFVFLWHDLFSVEQIEMKILNDMGKDLVVTGFQLSQTSQSWGYPWPRRIDSFFLAATRIDFVGASPILVEFRMRISWFSCQFCFPIACLFFHGPSKFPRQLCCPRLG